MAKLEKLLARADELGILDQVTDLVEAYVDAAEAYEANRDYDVQDVAIVELSPLPSAVWALGTLHRIEYDRIEEGELVRRYHDFEEDRPLLAVDQDEHRLWVVGGSYTVTERGIVG